jgi:hypothetical protein
MHAAILFDASGEITCTGVVVRREPVGTSDRHPTPPEVFRASADSVPSAIEYTLGQVSRHGCDRSDVALEVSGDDPVEFTLGKLARILAAVRKRGWSLEGVIANRAPGKKSSYIVIVQWISPGTDTLGHLPVVDPTEQLPAKGRQVPRRTD